MYLLGRQKSQRRSGARRASESRSVGRHLVGRKSGVLVRKSVFWSANLVETKPTFPAWAKAGAKAGGTATAAAAVRAALQQH